MEGDITLNMHISHNGQPLVLQCCNSKNISRCIFKLAFIQFYCIGLLLTFVLRDDLVLDT